MQDFLRSSEGAEITIWSVGRFAVGQSRTGGWVWVIWCVLTLNYLMS